MIQDRKILRLMEAFEDVMDEFEEIIVDHPAHLTRAVDSNATLNCLLDASKSFFLPLNQEIDAGLCLFPLNSWPV